MSSKRPSGSQQRFLYHAVAVSFRLVVKDFPSDLMTLIFLISRCDNQEDKFSLSLWTLQSSSGSRRSKYGGGECRRISDRERNVREAGMESGFLVLYIAGALPNFCESE